eukprot:GHVU01131072.1.p1 GENE.GHVU01131072.1~~GHVU01131072.1.p1  ORF type:complete len:120 (+),score=12.17 GHVU01131072.1:119-478(+)
MCACVFVCVCMCICILCACARVCMCICIACACVGVFVQIAKMVSSQKATELPPELRSLVRIIIVERGQTCLRSLPTDVSEFVLKHFESVGVKVEWKFESTITSVGENVRREARKEVGRK